MKKIIPGSLKKVTFIIFVVLVLLNADKSFAREHVVIIEEGAMVFKPEKLTISQGDVVRWENNDTSITYHMYASVPGSYDGEKAPISIITLNIGQSRELKFDTVGRFPYFCFIHKGMVGEIVVQSAK